MILTLANRAQQYLGVPLLSLRHGNELGKQSCIQKGESVRALGKILSALILQESGNSTII